MSCFYFLSNYRYSDLIYSSRTAFEFSDSDHILSCITPEHTHIARLTLPFSEARNFDGTYAFPTHVRVDDTKPHVYVTNNATLSNHQTIQEFLATQDPLKMVQTNGLLIGFIDVQTPELCAAAIKQTGNALQYIKEPTVSLCIQALETHYATCVDAGVILRIAYTHRDTLLTRSVCLAIVKREGLLLEHISDEFRKDVEICTEAVKQNALALKFALVRTPDMCMNAVERDGHTLAFVKVQTPELCIAAVKQTVDAVEFVKEKTPEILKHMFRDKTSKGVAMWGPGGEDDDG